MLNKIKSLFKKKEIVNTIAPSEYIYNYDWIAANFLVTEKEVTEKISETERREKLWKEAEETLFQMKKIKSASEKVYEKMLITDKMYKDSLYGDK
jgi:2-C-methyl-D-erythritol 4-phosphate cytidylyltransferase